MYELLVKCEGFDFDQNHYTERFETAGQMMAYIIELRDEEENDGLVAYEFTRLQ